MTHFLKVYFFDILLSMENVIRMSLFYTMIMVSLFGCNVEEVQEVVDGTVAKPTYTYTLKISATTTDYAVDVQTDTESLSTGTVTIGGTQDQYVLTGSEFTGTVTRYNGPGHVSIVVLKEGVNVWSESIMTTTGYKDLGSL